MSMENEIATRYDIYLCGPISTNGDKEENLKAFYANTDTLRRIGYTVFCPPEGEAPGHTWAEYLKRDIPHLLKSKAVGLLPRWDKSTGASEEKRLADVLGIPCYPVAFFLQRAVIERARAQTAPWPPAVAPRDADVISGESRTAREVLESQPPGSVIADDGPLPTTGIDRTFTTGAKRDSVEGKGAFHLLPPAALFAWAIRMQHGGVHHGERNWEQGIPLSSHLDSAGRHWLRLLRGDTDEDHAAGVLCNIGFYIQTKIWIEQRLLPPELDDRPDWMKGV